MKEIKIRDSEWRQKIIELEERCTDKLAEMQKYLDQAKYDRDSAQKDKEKVENVLRYVLDYFLEERNLRVSERDLDLFYLSDIFEEYFDGELNRVEDDD